LNQTLLVDSDDSSITLKKAFNPNDTDKPLFIDGEFKGMVSDIRTFNSKQSYQKQ